MSLLSKPGVLHFDPPFQLHIQGGLEIDPPKHTHTQSQQLKKATANQLRMSAHGPTRQHKAQGWAPRLQAQQS